jgi:hypothetical protein
MPSSSTEVKNVWVYKNQGQLYLFFIFKQILKFSLLALWVYCAEGRDLRYSFFIMTQCISEQENNFQSQTKNQCLTRGPS